MIRSRLFAASARGLCLSVCAFLALDAPVCAQFRAQYYQGRAFDQLVEERLDPSIDFAWGAGELHPLAGSDEVSIRWQGRALVPSDGLYTFITTSDDGIRLWVDGELVIDEWTIHAQTEHSASVSLVAGESVEVRVEFFEAAGQAIARLEWSGPGLARELVPGFVAGLDGLSAFEPFFGGVFPSTTPGLGGLTTTAASANLGVGMLLASAVAPNSTELYVGSRGGRIVRLTPGDSSTPGTDFLDLGSRVWTGQDSGLLGIAFHPEFGDVLSPHRGFVFVYYVHQLADEEFIRLSRFTVPDGSASADPNSELILIQQRLGPTLHRGGGLLFGADGFLYLSIGDLGWPSSSQRIDDLFNSAVLRIDVDQDPSRSHPIATPLLPGDSESFTGHYMIPDDNPFVGTAGALEEYFALGLRNPHRMSVDGVSGLIHIGDVGSNTGSSLEEINVVQAGGNYGWPFREGASDIDVRPSTILGQVVDPAISYARVDGACVIGGHVYRGSAMPWLQGRYVFGDFTNGKVWMTQDEFASGPKQLLFTTSAGMVNIAVDHQGELYVTSGDSILHRIEEVAPTPEAPALLSQTGVFSDLQTLQPVPAFVPYDVLSPLWSDGALKSRWLAVPNAGVAPDAADRIGFDPVHSWQFPVGSVFIKHFELPLSDGSMRRLETRFLAHGDDGEYYGVTYRWRPDGSDADLLTEGAQDVIEGQVWDYPSRADCLTCHNTTAGSVLGPRASQLAGDTHYPGTGRSANQLATLSQLGLLEPQPTFAEIDEGERLAPIEDVTTFLQDRARSYLQSNCAQCHQPDGVGRGVFDARYETPFARQSILLGDVAETFGIDGAKVLVPGDLDKSILHRRLDTLDLGAMPPLAKNRVDEQAVALFEAWIDVVNAPRGAFTGEYYSGRDFGQLELVREDPLICFDWGGNAPADGLPSNEFSVRWTGSVVPEFSEDYVFHATTDDGVRLYLDGQLVIDDWTLHAAREFTTTWTATAGVPVAVVMEYFEAGGQAVAELEWSSPTLGREHVRAQDLSNTAPVATSRMVSVLPEAPSSIFLEGTDAEELRLDAAVHELPRHGTLTGFGRDLTYLPEPGFVGTDRFQFRLSDGTLESAPAEVTIEVGCPVDCNGDGVFDDCLFDCDADGTPDACEADCDSNGVPDDCESPTDCDGNGIPDLCETLDDCDGNGVPDVCEALEDCDGNGIPDVCETQKDCDGNGVPDVCETQEDCDGNGVPDVCETQEDCDGNGVPDVCETQEDCDGNGVPDACETQEDCDGNGIPDVCETQEDCDGNGVPDVCETQEDCDGNGVPDVCETQEDCDGNGVPDACETQEDCDGNGVPDACETQEDCDGNGVPDVCETQEDCDGNGVPDVCETQEDCDGNGVPDICETQDDCDGNGVPDVCETQEDCDGNGIPDACETQEDCDGNGVPDICETHEDCDGNGVPDTCEALEDCDSNGVPDACETHEDCDANGVPDVCESLSDCDGNGVADVCEGLADCDANGVADSCEIDADPDLDRNGDGVLDLCQGVGTAYCAGLPNSTGVGAALHAVGSARIVDNDLTFVADDLPPNVFGLLFYGTERAQLPFGNGTRCVGGTLQRVQPAAQASAAGTLVLGLDLQSPPIAGSVSPGSVRDFQFWYRDSSAGGAGFNLTGAVEIPFE